MPLDPRVTSCLMPSKLYGVLASGTPLLAIAPEDCELAELTRCHAVGVVVAPGEPRGAGGRDPAAGRSALGALEMGRRARQLAESQYDRKQATASFGKLLFEVLGCEEGTRPRVEPVAQCESS